MASVASAIISEAGGKAVEGIGIGISDVINAIKGHNPEDAVTLQTLVSKHSDLIAQLEADRIKNQAAENVQLNQIASDNVKADAAGKNWFQQNDRPAIIWMGIIILFVNYGIAFFLQKWGFKPLDFPTVFWETWAILATGVVFNRTAGTALDTVLGGQGGTVKLPGIHLESKGD